MNELLDKYQALLIVSFGGPDSRDDVMPFLANVLRGKNVPEARMLEVAEHYYHLGGVSPINRQNRDLIAALQQDFNRHDIRLPIYYGNRNWHPMLPDTLQQMKTDGVRSALAFFTSAFSSYSGCRQYREDIMAAQESVGDGAPDIHKLRNGFNHPLFIAANSDRVVEANQEIPGEARSETRVVFTAHSIPQSMADGCDYQVQLMESCRLVAEQAGVERWNLVFQSRSGPPHQPWLGPDVCDFLDGLNATDDPHVVLMPIGFVSDHMEVLFDLDIEAKQKCDEKGINMIRAKAVGTHPQFVTMIRELIFERVSGSPKSILGNLPPRPDTCPADCCLSGR